MSINEIVHNDNWDVINKNLFIIGLCSIINAYGVRFLWDDLNKIHKEWFLNLELKKIVIFSVLFITTRNFIISFILFICYLMFTKYIKKKNHRVHPIFD